MIYLISFPILFAVIYCVLWVSGAKRELRKKDADIEYYREQNGVLNVALYEKNKEIKILIEGGICEQEAVQMKYKKIYDDEKKNQEIARIALNSFHQRYSGLQGMGGNFGMFQRRF